MSEESHDDEIATARSAVAATDRDAVVTSFVASLRRRSLPARSPFGSLVVLHHLPEHAWRRSEHFAGEFCAECGLPRVRRVDDEPDPEAPARYPVQARHTDVRYATADLATAPDRLLPAVDAEDDAALRAMLDALRALPPGARLGDLHDALAPVIRSNKLERTALLEVLGFAGILLPAGHESYAEDWVGYDKANLRQPANRAKREWSYPVRFWEGTDGVDEEKVTFWFGRHS